MGLFDKKKKPEPVQKHQPVPAVSQPKVTSPQKPVQKRSETILSSGVEFEGKLTSKDPLSILGTFIGEIISENAVHVGQGGFVKGDIQAQSISIEGKVHGNLKAKEKVILLARGEVRGDITADKITIQENAFFTGRVHMHSNSSGQDKQKSSARKKESKPARAQASS